jgi:prolipoprotein diacylglyceryl transferase
VAIAFMVAYWVLTREIKRKQAQGIFETKRVKVMEGGPVSEWDVLGSFALFGLVGYKLGLMLISYDDFYQNPQEAILSLRGNFTAALLAALAGGGYRFWQYWQKRNEKPKEQEVERGLLDEMGTILTIAFVGGLLGAKVFHNLENWDTFISDPVGSLLSFDGLTFYGGLIVAGAGIIWFLRKKDYPILPFADAIAPAMILSYGVGRIGCQVAGDGDWGRINPHPKPDWLAWAPDWVWKFDFPNNVLQVCNPSRIHYPDIQCSWDEIGRLAEPVYPTAFYETLMTLVIFGILWALRKHLPFWGQMTGIYLIFNGMERFLIEQIRVNTVYHILGGEITQAELISSGMMLAGVVVLLLASLRWRKS